MGRFFTLVLLAGVGFGGWWFWNHNQQLRDVVDQYIENGEFLTLEARYTPERIMEAHKKELLPDPQHAFQEPILKFYPYLLIDTKFVQPDRKTREGFLLWCLTDGEMLLDTDTWEKTHGFEDAINAHATRSDFKIMNALAKNGSPLSLEELQKDLHVETEMLSPWIEGAIDKHLIIRSGNEVQLHFQNPKIYVIPQTKIKQEFVSKPVSQSQRSAKRYSRSQVERIANAAFGPTFTIRSVREIYLPVFSIIVQNPDGTTHTSLWNAITGQRIIDIK